MASSWPPSVWASAGAAALALLVGCSGGGDPAAGDGDPPAAGVCGPARRLRESRGGGHVIGAEGAEYDHHPPSAGPHFAGNPPRTGVYEEPLEYFHQVLALEVGNVVVQYDASVGDAGVARLEALAEGRGDVIVTPAPGPIDDGRPVALTAWELRRLCRGVSDDVIDAAGSFIADHAGRARPDDEG